MPTASETIGSRAATALISARPSVEPFQDESGGTRPTARHASAFQLRRCSPILALRSPLSFPLERTHTCPVAAAYDELNHLFEEQLKRSAIFVRVAFHVHSPDSHDWG